MYRKTYSDLTKSCKYCGASAGEACWDDPHGKEMKAVCIQSDRRHPCHVPMWHCSICKKDHCGDEPKFCPMCGAEFGEIVTKDK